MGSLAQASGRRYQVVNASPDDHDAWLESISLVLQNVISGKLNNNGTVTLTANAASTTLTDSRIGANTTVSIMPTTANAAGAIATTYFDTFTTGSCLIHHTNNAQTDKIFSYTVIG